LCDPGEELTVNQECELLNAGHLGSHFITSFIQQSPEKTYWPTHPTSQQAIDIVNSQNGLAIICHPKYFLWDWPCIDNTNNVGGIEIWNGGWHNSGIYLSNNRDALNLWVDFLLKGRKVFAFGGADSHDSASDVVYNGVYLQNFKKGALKNALKNGRSFVSNNGFLSFKIHRLAQITDGKSLGEELDVCEEDKITISIDYNVENSCELVLKKGYINFKEVTKQDFGSIIGSGTKTLDDYAVFHDGYYRLECVNEEENNRIYTNPIWFDVRSLCSDVNNNNEVNILDIAGVAVAFGSTPGENNWNPITDINGDEVINILDISQVAVVFGKTGPREPSIASFVCCSECLCDYRWEGGKEGGYEGYCTSDCTNQGAHCYSEKPWIETSLCIPNSANWYSGTNCPNEIFEWNPEYCTPNSCENKCNSEDYDYWSYDNPTKVCTCFSAPFDF